MKLIGLTLEAALPALESAHALWPAEGGGVLCAWRAERGGVLCVWPAERGGVLCVRPRDPSECTLAERLLAPSVSPLLRVREVVHWDELGEPDGDTVALICFVRRRSGMPYAAFESYYRERHAKLAREHHPGIVRYVQNFLSEPGDAEHEVDAVSELWFASERDSRERFYRDTESPRIVAEDVARFLEPRAGMRCLTRPARSAPRVARSHPR